MIDETLKTEAGLGYLKWLSDAQLAHPREPGADPLIGYCRQLEACVEAQSHEIEALRKMLRPQNDRHASSVGHRAGGSGEPAAGRYVAP